MPGLLASLALALCAQAASAIGLGPANVSSALGEPLRLSVPVTLQPDEEAGCIQVRSGSGDLPGVFNTRAQVVRAGGATRIEVRSAQPVNEPAIGIVLSVGCSSPISRDYVLFLDPPVVAPSVASSGDAAPVATPLRRVNPMPTPVRRVRSASASAATNGEVSARPQARARSVRPKPRVAPPAPLTVPEAVAGTRPATTAPATAAAVAPVGTDRLSVVPTDAVRA